MAVEIRFGIFKDPVAATTHFVGAIAALVGLIFLVLYAAGDPAKVTGASIYGGALLSLFLASSCYHFFEFGKMGNWLLRRIDHTAIYLLICGTYMPALLITLEGRWRIAMISVVGGLTIVGILFELVWPQAPRWLSTSFYLVLGWMIVVPAPLIFPRLSTPMLVFLMGGGCAYTLGALVYIFKWPDPWKRHFGFHEIWHLFVLAGATMQYFFVYHLLDLPRAPF